MTASPPRPPQEAREIELVSGFEFEVRNVVEETYGDAGISENDLAQLKIARAALLAHMRTERKGREAAHGALRDAASTLERLCPHGNKDTADSECGCAAHCVARRCLAALAHSTGGGDSTRSIP